MRYFITTGYKKQFGIFDRRIAEILDKNYLKKGIVLDIGCGYGNLLQAIRELNHHIMGVDNDLDSERVCKEKGLEFYKCDVDKEKLAFSNGSIDNIICFHLIEHLKNALEFLEKCHSILKKNGRIVIVCPDWNFFKGYWDSPTHFTPITRKRMEKMLAMTGFKLIESKPFKKPDWLKWIWRYFDFPFFIGREFFLCAAIKGGTE